MSMARSQRRSKQTSDSKDKKATTDSSDAEDSPSSKDDGILPCGHSAVLAVRSLALTSKSFFHMHPEESFESLILDRAGKLVRLALTGNAFDASLLTNKIAPLILAHPQLESLELSGVDIQSSDGPVLRDVVAGLENLKYLELNEVLCLTDDWADVEWKSSLRSLLLDDCQHISDVGLESLLQRHSSTLRVLSLEMVPNAGTLAANQAAAMNQGPAYDLPKLQDLSIDNTEHTADFLKRFSACPNLYRIQLGLMEDVTPRDLLLMLEKGREHKAISGASTRDQDGEANVVGVTTSATPDFPALKDLILSDDWSDFERSPAMESLQLLCFQSGINLSIEDPDPDDEDMDDDDDDMYSDMDELDQAMADELNLEMDEDDDEEEDEDDDDDEHDFDDEDDVDEDDEF